MAAKKEHDLTANYAVKGDTLTGLKDGTVVRIEGVIGDKVLVTYFENANRIGMDNTFGTGAVPRVVAVDSTTFFKHAVTTDKDLGND